MSLTLLGDANLSSVRWAKSSQGNRRGTCGWITSFYFLFYTCTSSSLFLPTTFIFIASQENSKVKGPVVKPGYNAPLARERLRVQMIFWEKARKGPKGLKVPAGPYDLLGKGQSKTIITNITFINPLMGVVPEQTFNQGLDRLAEIHFDEAVYGGDPTLLGG
jgi:hypothetical protein